MGSAGSRGRISAGTAVFLLLVVLCIYVAVQVLPPYVDYLFINDGVETAVRMAAIPPRSEEGLRQQVRQILKERGVSIPDQQIVVTLDHERATARLQWSASVQLLWYTHVMQFRVAHSERLR